MKEFKYFFLFAIIIIIYFSDALVSNKLIAIGDGIIQNYPLHSFFDQQFKNYSFPLWLPNEYLGLPFVGLMHTGILYPPNIILHFLFDSAIAYNLGLLLHYLIAAYFTFLYIRLIGCRIVPAFIGGIVFSLSGFLIAHHGHYQMQNAASLFPVIIFTYEKIRQTINYKYSIISGIVIALQMLAGHMQISIYTLIYIAIYIVYYFFYIEKRNKLRFLLISILPVLISMIIALPQIVESIELSEQSWRSKLSYEFFAEYSFAPYHFISFIFPYLYGGGAGMAMWAPWPFSDFMCYVGILPLLIAIVVSISKFKLCVNTRFWTIVSAVAIFLMLGKYNPLSKIMLFVPGYNIFRAPARHLFILNFSITILAAIGMKEMLDYGKLSKLITKRLILVLIITLFAAFAAIMALKLILPKLPYEVIKYDPFSLKNVSIFYPFIIMILSLFLVLIHHKKEGHYVNKLILALILMDVFSFGFLLAARGLWQNHNKLDDLCNTGLYKFINDEYNSRTAFIDMDNHLNFVQCNIFAFTGYDPNMLKKYQFFTDASFYHGYKYDWKKLILDNKILSMCNVKYIVKIFSDDTDKDELNVILENNSNYKRVADFGVSRIYFNNRYLPRVFFINQIEPAMNLMKIKDAFSKKEISPDDIAFVFYNDYVKIREHKFTKGVAKMVAYKPNYIILDVISEGVSFVVLSEIFYPGWKAFVDGKETKLYEVNGLLRGIIINKGHHLVIVKYEPAAFYNSCLISLAIFLILIGCMIKISTKKMLLTPQEI